MKQVNIIWRMEWTKEYETPWSIFEKISLANLAARNVLLREFGSSGVKKLKSTIGNIWREFVTLEGFDEEILTYTLGFNLKYQNSHTINKIIGPLHKYHHWPNFWFRDHLRWCHQCISTGFHSWLHQFILIDKCPYHDVDLMEACPNCSKQIPFLLSDVRLSKPFTCKCGFALSNPIKWLWRDWNKAYELQNSSVLQWISNYGGAVEDDTWIFLPQKTSLELMCCKRSHQIRRFSIQDNNMIGGSNSRLTLEQNKTISNDNKDMFKSIDRHIRKTILHKHSHCIKQFRELRNTGQVEFPKICPYAYAYVFWRQTILKNSNFYRYNERADDIEIEIDDLNALNERHLLFATKLIGDELKYLFEQYFEINKSKERNFQLLRWVLKKFTADFCFEFFDEWLQIAGDRSDSKTVPRWNTIYQMKHDSIKNFIFKLKQPNEDYIEVSYYRDQNKMRYISEYNCPNSSQRSKNIIKTMRTYDPLRAAMDVYSNPTSENKQFKRYVDQYVARLKI